MHQRIGNLNKVGRLYGAIWNADVVARGALVVLLCLTTLLPIAIVLVIGTSALFAALNDVGAARALNAVAVALGLAWILSLVGLAIALAVDALARHDRANLENINEDDHGVEP